MKIELQDKYQLYIGGQWKDASDKSTFKTFSPAANVNHFFTLLGKMFFTP